jgi:hypothetical protein
MDVSPMLESITLYGGENESTAVKVPPIASMPVISLDDSTIDLGSGLSPLFKAEEPKSEKPPTEAVLPVALPVALTVALTEADKTTADAEAAKSENATSVEGVIVKTTPRTLLKSRSKNNRLSLSTPRRRNSHVRALDFNTPMKLAGSARKMPQSCGKTKATCRAGLFRSPPFGTDRIAAGTEPSKPAYMRVPIATRSPAPKLQGNWSKLTGIGLILGDASTSESSSPEKSQVEVAPVIAKKSWDSDLRQIVGNAIPQCEAKHPIRIARKTKRRNAVVKASAKAIPRPKIQEPAVKVVSTTSLAKISPEVSACPVSRFPDMLDLETPRKTEATFYVPPTPRLLSTPGDSLTTSGRPKPNDELTIKDCIDTPDFPITPCIILTPKIIEEEHEKKSSPYYEPCDDQTQPLKSKDVLTKEKPPVSVLLLSLFLSR